jgi:hypothetical protein
MSRRIAPFMLIVLLALAACGGGGGGGGADEGSDLPTSATATSEDEEGTVYPLAPGRYRLEWTVEGCDFPTIQILDSGGGLVYEQTPRLRIVFVEDVPGGDMMVTQTNPDCTDWEIELLEF